MLLIGKVLASIAWLLTGAQLPLHQQPFLFQSLPEEAGASKISNSEWSMADIICTTHFCGPSLETKSSLAAHISVVTASEGQPEGRTQATQFVQDSHKSEDLYLPQLFHHQYFEHQNS